MAKLKILKVRLKKGMIVKNKKTGEVVVATEKRFGTRSFTDALFFNLIHTDWEIAQNGSMANGGTIPNQYEGKTAEQVWNEWTERQRNHFAR